MTLQRLITAILVAGTFAILSAGPASAHAILRATTPGDGEQLDAVPATVSLEFNEPVSTTAGGVRVFNTEGARVDLGDAETPTDALEKVEVGLQPALGNGTYVVSWRALSADSHPVHGAFVFTVGDVTADEAVISEILAGTSDTGFERAATVLRFLQYLAALIAAGGVLFLVWIHDRAESERAPMVRTVIGAGIVVAVVTVIGMGVQAALVTGLGASAVVDAGALGEVVGSSYGVSSGVMLVGLVLLIVGTVRLWRAWAVVTATAGAVVLMGSFVIAGHTATTEPRWLVVLSDAVHTVAGAAWLGGLVLLMLALKRRRAADDPVGGAGMVSRFSTMATGAIVAVSVTGTALAWAEVRALRALLSTGYGITLLVKVTLVGLVLLIGAYNHRRLVPAIRRAGPDAWTRLRSTVRWEVAGLLLVVAVTAVLVNLVPARDAAGVTGPLSVRQPLGDEHTIDITVDPNRVGLNEMHIYVYDANGRATEAEEISVGLSMPANDIGPIEREPTPTGPGHWTLTAAELPIAGRWIVTVDVAVTRFDEATAEIPIDVGG